MARRKFLSIALFTAVLAAAALAPAIAPRPVAAAVAPSPTDPQPVGVVVLVDESGSLAASGVTAERAATETIVQAELSTSSQLAVVGFAGRNGGAGQSPVDVVCQPRTVSVGLDRDYLADCTQHLTPRTEAQGDDTDFPSALSEGLSLLGGMTGVQNKMIFMLTDGQLDVRRDPAYGPNGAARQQAAQRALIAVLAKAKGQNVSIWPLGFNQAVPAELRQLAAGGAQGNPQCPDNSRPVYRIVSSTSDILASLVDAFASARCGAVDGPVPGFIQPGQSGPTELHLTIPAVATDGSIAVDKVDPTVNVTYIDPDGHPAPTPTGSIDKSSFQLSGQTSPVEVLRVVNPVPGTWTVELSPPTDGSALAVSATVLWQGAVQSSIVLDPPAPRPGQTAAVTLVLATRLGPLAQPAALAGISARAVLTGNGFGPVDIGLTPGSGGQFTGQVRMPDTGTGPFQLVGLVSGTGISNDQRPLYGQFDVDDVTLIAQATFGTGQVQPGGELTGVVQFQNDTTATHTVALTLAGVSGGLVTLSPNGARVPPGTSQLSFRLHIGSATPLGAVRGQLTIGDATGTVYADPVFTIDVGYPPPLWQRYLWVLVLAAALVIGALVAVAFAVRRRAGAREVRDLSAKLYRDERLLFNLHAPDGHRAEFRFALQDGSGQPPTLQHATNGHTPIVVRRSGPAYLSVAAPGRQLQQVRPGEPVDLNDGFSLTITDDRPSGRGRPPRVSGRHTRPPRATPTGGQSQQLQPVPHQQNPDAPDPDDDLL